MKPNSQKIPSASEPAFRRPPISVPDQVAQKIRLDLMARRSYVRSIDTQGATTMKRKMSQVITASALGAAAVFGLALSAPASAQPNATREAPIHGNDNSAVRQLFDEPTTIDAWRNAVQG
jgi:hypothetical protein